MTDGRPSWHYHPPMRGVLWAVLFAAVVWIIIGAVTLYLAGHL